MVTTAGSRRTFVLAAVLIVGVLIFNPLLAQVPVPSSQPTPDPGPPFPVPPGEAVPTFQFKIDPKTPLKDLLPVPPKISRLAGPVVTEELSQVPEMRFQEPLPIQHPPKKEPVKNGFQPTKLNTKGREHIAHQIAKIHFLNQKKTDHFMEMLVENRPDLAGLPFMMGKACRLTSDQSQKFGTAVNVVRGAQQPQPIFATSGIPADFPKTDPVPSQPPAPFPPPPPTIPKTAAAISNPEAFWNNYPQHWRNSTDFMTTLLNRGELNRAQIAALMQILAPEAAKVRVGLVKHLATMPQRKATEALAKLAIFSFEDEVRQAALGALAQRPRRDSTDILLEGLNYPLPAVARNATAAMVHLQRQDLVPQLVDSLDQPDPRAPILQEIKGEKVPVVRELVKVNHHRNCLLCHAPANTGDINRGFTDVVAAMPVPGESFPPPSLGYNGSPSGDIVVRVDVTYLRQDFSVFQKVADAAPWPEMQRFDFLVRTRTLTADEAKTYQAEFARREKTSPYRQATLVALRALTGQDAGRTSPAWRKVLDRN